MTPEKIIEAANTLQWIVEQLNQLPESKSQATSDALMCSLAQNFCLDFAKSMMQNRDDPYAALVRTVNGGNELTESQKTLAKILLGGGSKS